MVTGSTGFIGRPLITRLAAAGWRLHEWREDIRRIRRYSQPVDVVFHLAAITRHEQFLAAPKESHAINVEGTRAVLDYCQAVGAKCVFISSSAVYAAAPADGNLRECDPLGPVTAYGASKLQAEQLCRERRLPVTILRLFNVYGPGQHPAYIVPYILACLRAGRPLELRMPQAQRDFIYVADVLEALILAVWRSGDGCAVFNIGSGVATRIAEVVRLAERMLGRKAVGIATTSTELVEVPAAIADIGLAAKGLNWTPRYTIEAGLAALLAE